RDRFHDRAHRGAVRDLSRNRRDTAVRSDNRGYRAPAQVRRAEAVIDFTETVVLPENELAKRRPPPCSRAGAIDTAFDETLVLEDELEQRRRLGSANT